jgi:hypothetical protein
MIFQDEYVVLNGSLLELFLGTVFRSTNLVV